MSSDWINVIELLQACTIGIMMDKTTGTSTMYRVQVRV